MRRPVRSLSLISIAKLAWEISRFESRPPTFGSGLVESILDATILANQGANLAAKRALGISGIVNRNGNDGTITRFGWKAQNISMQVFAGEAYNVEMGVTNELFGSERASPGEILPNSCQLNGGVEDRTNFDAVVATAVPSDVVQFSTFMRFLDAPTASRTLPGGANSIASGRQLFCEPSAVRALPHALAGIKVCCSEFVSRICLCASYGSQSCRRRFSRIGGARSIPQRAALGSGSADLLPA